MTLNAHIFLQRSPRDTLPQKLEVIENSVAEPLESRNGTRHVTFGAMPSSPFPKYHAVATCLVKSGTREQYLSTISDVTR